MLYTRMDCTFKEGKKMLELKFMRENVEMLKEMLKNRNSNIDMDAFVALDAKRREVLSEVETLKRDRNNVSAEIANLKKKKRMLVI